LKGHSAEFCQEVYNFITYVASPAAYAAYYVQPVAFVCVDSCREACDNRCCAFSNRQQVFAHAADDDQDHKREHKVFRIEIIQPVRLGASAVQFSPALTPLKTTANLLRALGKQQDDSAVGSPVQGHTHKRHEA
jgi:hypothetical protein